jgi:uncharacterized protein YaaN involved in tellurite resistance
MGDQLKTDKASRGDAPAAVKTETPVAIAETAALVLTPPAPVAEVAPRQAEDAVKLDAETIKKLDELVKAYVDAIATLDVHDPGFEARATDIRTLGQDDIKASAQVSSRLLDRPVSAMKHGGIEGSAEVSNSLIALRRQIDELDPAHQGDLFSPRKLFGIIPWGDRLRDYFDRYRSSQSHINAIIKGLDNGKTTLEKDNADLEQEKANLWAIMERLRQYLYLAQKLDAGLDARIAAVAKTDPERAKILREDMLFYVRQKVEDLTTQLAVSVQGYLALDVIRRNNLELTRGVDRATTTTVSALRTAVIVAQALGDQKLVLDQITALNATTSNLIESTSVLLRQQSGAINEQASAATIELAKLQAAFENIYATMDEIDAFKLKALDTMTQTVNALTTQIGKAQPYLDRAQSRDEAASTEGSGLVLPE